MLYIVKYGYMIKWRSQTLVFYQAAAPKITHKRLTGVKTRTISSY